MSFNLDLKKVEIPELKEVKAYRGSYYLVGKDNKFFNELIYLYEKSSIHNSFINNFTQKTIGSGFIGSNDQSQAIIESMDLNETLGKVVLDYGIFGGFCLEIIWNTLHTKITEVNYLDFSKVRSGYIDEDTDEVELYSYSYDWFAYHKNISIYKKFDTSENSDNRQIFYYKGHHPGTDIYPRPLYLGGLKYIYTDIELSKYYVNLVKNNFVGNTIINIPNGGNMSADKQVEFETGIKDNFTSSENAGSIVVLYGDGENEVQLLEFGKGADDAKYQWITQQTTDQLVISHRIPNPIIAGVRVPGSLGGTQEMSDAENIYNKNVIYPSRIIFTRTFQELNKWLVVPLEVEPITDVSLFESIEDTPA